jgi:hypothetical protein
VISGMYDIPEGSKTIPAAVPIVPFAIPIMVPTLAKTITGMSRVYTNIPGNGHFVPSSARASKSPRGSGKFDVVLVRKCSLGNRQRRCSRAEAKG